MKNKLLMPMRLQFFATDESGGSDNGHIGNEGEEATEQNNKGEDGAVEVPKITPEIQAMIDSVVGKEKARLKAKFESEKTQEIDKAKKLAAMSEKERKEEEENERIRKLEEREKAIELKEYRLEAVKQLETAKLSAELVDIVISESPETTASNIKALRKQIDLEIEAEVKKRLGGKEPTGGTGTVAISRGEQVAKEMNQRKETKGNDPWGK